MRNAYNINHMEKSGGFVYIMTNKRNGTLYIGSTSDLIGRVFEHKRKLMPKSFTARYNLDKLVYFEHYVSLKYMVVRERQMKEWKRDWKIKLIESMNPNWDDLFNKLLIETGYEPVDI